MKKIICLSFFAWQHQGHEVYLASDVLEDEKLVVDGDIQKGLKASENLTAFLVVAEQVNSVRKKSYYFSVQCVRNISSRL